jgi:hypothetical protein
MALTYNIDDARHLAVTRPFRGLFEVTTLEEHLSPPNGDHDIAPK